MSFSKIKKTLKQHLSKILVLKERLETGLQFIGK